MFIEVELLVFQLYIEAIVLEGQHGDVAIDHVLLMPGACGMLIIRHRPDVDN